ncbi:MAG: 50S ribosomal protein L3 [Nitrospiria bacterium]
MVNGLMGYKLGMTQVFSGDGFLVPVTVLEVGPCRVVQLKTLEQDGYKGVQLSIGEMKSHRVSRPLLGHYKKAGLPPARFIREFSGSLEALTIGMTLSVDLFDPGSYVDVTGVSKGKGFQGVVKRHNYAGGPASHGSKSHRRTGSIGHGSNPSRVWKNKGMPGHMGNNRSTIQSLLVVDIRPSENLMFVKGAVPGSVNGLVLIQKSVKRPLNDRVTNV